MLPSRVGSSVLFESFILTLIIAISGLDRQRPTSARIKAIIVKLARWKGLAESLQISDTLLKIEEMEADLQELILTIKPHLKLSDGDSKPKRGTGYAY